MSEPLRWPFPRAGWVCAWVRFQPDPRECPNFSQDSCGIPPAAARRSIRVRIGPRPLSPRNPRTHLARPPVAFYPPSASCGIRVAWKAERTRLGRPPPVASSWRSPQCALSQASPSQGSLFIRCITASQGLIRVKPPPTYPERTSSLSSSSPPACRYDTEVKAETSQLSGLALCESFQPRDGRKARTAHHCS